MKINCIAIEDEPLALNKLREFIQQIDYLNLLEGFHDPVEALNYIKKHSVDLIFLDIRMKKLTGIQFLEALKLDVKVIITSAYDEYALKGYELNVADYLLKPYSFDRFLKSIDKIYHELQSSEKSNHHEYIFVKTEYRIEKIELKDILFIQGMKDYLQINTLNKKIMTLQTFSKIMKILPESDFQRVHNSYVVSISKIESIERNRIKMNEHLIPISDRYKSGFYDLLKKRKMFI